MNLPNSRPHNNPSVGVDGLTPVQNEIIGFMTQRAILGMSPASLRELAAVVNRSISTVTHHLKHLEAMGFVTVSRKAARGWRLAGDFRMHAGLVRVPPLVTDPLDTGQAEGFISLPRQLVGSGEIRLMRVPDAGMTGSGILPGDLAAIGIGDTEFEGKIVAARIGNDIALRRFTLVASTPWLLPDNSAFRPIIGTDADILGPVAAVLRSL
ncbi:LexA family protein [Streptomyces sp. NPDC056672]|uniref:LexA family protein n=1 Tax=Streptomyces sp. NPDC056672 TaxID=3345906 RepID=UPI003693CB18